MAGAHQLAFDFADGLTLLIENCHRHAQTSTLDFTAIHRLNRYADHEARQNVGPTGDRGQV
ncbi:hypothetical protein D3C81_2107120 [compost metagenome]